MVAASSVSGEERCFVRPDELIEQFVRGVFGFQFVEPLVKTGEQLRTVVGQLADNARTLVDVARIRRSQRMERGGDDRTGPLCAIVGMSGHWR